MCRTTFAIACTLAVLAACGRDTEPRSTGAVGELPADADRDGATVVATTDESRPAPASEPNDLEMLAALGYVAESPIDVDAPRGVTLLDAERAHPGYTLVLVVPLGRAELVALDGTVVASWSEPRARHWTRAELSPRGDLLAISALGDAPDVDPDAHPFRGAALVCFDFAGAERWRRESYPHHDISPTPGGAISYLDKDVVQRHDLRLTDNVVVVVDDEGNELARHGVLEAVLEHVERDALRDRDFSRSDRPHEILHANSIDWLRHTGLVGTTPMHRKSCVLVSLRNLNLVVALDTTRSKVVWSFGPGELQGQHEATWLPNGNVLVFDNGFNVFEADGPSRGWSRVVEIDPRSSTIVWEWHADEPTDFYSEARGTAQALPNGNVLVASSQQGRVFEITRDGDIVWDWTCPHDGPGGGVAVVRAQRYDAAFVERLLRESGRDTAAGR